MTVEFLAKGLCEQREIAMHTHDRIAFKRCRRKWSFSSPFKRHLQPKASKIGVNPNLWFGSGIHFALEDYHGYNRFGHPVEAFKVYVEAFPEEERPIETDDLIELGIGMLNHCVDWEKDKAKWKTVWLDGKPLVEQKFSLVLEDLCYYELDILGEVERYFKIPGSNEWKSESGDIRTEENLRDLGAEYVEIVYHGTFDRIVEDEHGDWWVLDYKTAKSYDMNKLATDPQISAYCWAAEQWFERPIAGMLYIQMLKRVPQAPRRNTKGLSTDKRQKTTHKLYRQALIELYGDVSKAPKKNIDFLNDLAFQEAENGDAFIRYDFVPRNDYSKKQTYKAIIQEGREMLNPNLPLYPNPTKDCAWDCPFRAVCVAMDEGADWEYILENEFEPRHETMKDELPAWMLRIIRKHPDKYPDEYNKYCRLAISETLEEFIKRGEE